MIFKVTFEGATGAVVSSTKTLEQVQWLIQIKAYEDEIPSLMSLMASGKSIQFTSLSGDIVNIEEL